ncbi:prolipoprotein diacylglyceryl transferase [Gammaproteobacteria bacterium]|nr:prolipoprotein diacylglyceryl transferase [Gammaproteobacteria bacterium]
MFDAVAWLSAAASAWLLYRWRFRSRVDALSKRLGSGYFAALAGGGIAGAYLFGTLNAVLSGQAGLGRSILGALLGAITAIEIYKHRKGVSGSTGAVLAVPFSLAVAIGRVGCYQSGMTDYTYGITTDLPWGVDFGDGVQRHPVQLYESLTMAVVTLVLFVGLLRQSPRALASGFYMAVGIYGVQRLMWEFLKPYGTLIGPFNLFHFLCLILVVYAMAMLYLNRDERT